MPSDPQDPAGSSLPSSDDDGAAAPVGDVAKSAPTADGDLDSRAFRDVMARFGTGVTVMTAVDAAGEVTGMTANAVASVSLDPLLVLVCVDVTTDMATKVQSGRRFALSMLGADQQNLSDHFADPSRSRGWEGFADVAVTTATTGSPVLAGSMAWLDCTVDAIHPGGDHLIVVGAVVAAGVGQARPALGWFDHGYTTITTT